MRSPLRAWSSSQRYANEPNHQPVVSVWGTDRCQPLIPFLLHSFYKPVAALLVDPPPLKRSALARSAGDNSRWQAQCRSLCAMRG